MIDKKYIFVIVLLYCASLGLFFKSQFVSYQQIEGYSSNHLTTKPIFKQNDKLQKYEHIKIKNNKQTYIQSSIHEKKQIQANNENDKTQYSFQDNLLPKVSQVILIIIDALRYDYINRISFFNDTLKKHPNSTIIKKSIAGLPTMTTQRIQSFMTGSQIFTSTNILDMFLSAQTKVDNLITQLNNKNYKVKVFGDDTWTKLFNIQESNSFVCDSTFNIKDFDGCDNLIYNNLHDHLKKDNTKTDIQSPSLLIAHFLSIDHIGHSTSSITSPQIQKKMDRMSAYFNYLQSIASDDTMFIITGDHGMRQDGNHGGSTKAETQTLLFAYYKSKESIKQSVDFNKRVKNFQRTYVNQVDLTPTLSLLLGVPNPINSIGYPIIQILPSNYASYLQKIEWNVLQGYKKIIFNYDNQLKKSVQLNQQKYYSQQHQQSLTASLSSSSPNFICLKKINKLQQELSTNLMNKSSEQGQKQHLLNKNKQELLFHNAVQRKQYIKSQIQLSRCLAAQLSFTQPNNFGVYLGLLGMFISFIFYLIITYLDDLKEIFSTLLSQNSSQLFQQRQHKRYILRKIRLISIQFIGWICSLCSIYFSWYLIRNSSTYLTILILIIIALVPSSTFKFTQKINITFLILLLTQLQKPKINEYELNYFNFQLKQDFLTLIKTSVSQDVKEYFLSLEIAKRLSINWFNFAAINLWFLLKFKKGIHILKHLRKNQIVLKRKINTKIAENKNQLQQNYNELKQSKYDILFSLFLTVLSYLNIISPTFVKEQSQYDHNYVYYLRYFIILFTMLKIAYNKSRTQDKGNQSVDKKNSIERQKLLSNRMFDSECQLYLIILFGNIFGLEDFLSLIIYIAIIKQVLDSQKRDQKMTNIYKFYGKIKMNNQRYNSPPQTSELSQIKRKYDFYAKIVFLSLVCQYMWWILGNKYQYSSIDIRKSYILSQNFNIFINAVVMIAWFTSPHIICLLLIQQSLNTKAAQYYQHEKSQQQEGIIKIKAYEQESDLLNQPQAQTKKDKIQKKTEMSSYHPSFQIGNKDSNNPIEKIKNSSQQKFELKQQQQCNNHINKNVSQNVDVKNLAKYNQGISLQLKRELMQNYCKFMLVSLSGLLSACINLAYNNEKILFTVVYVPLMMFGVVKTVIVALLIVFLVLKNC